MSFTYKVFTPNMVDTYFQSYIKTIENLVPAGEQTQYDMKQNLTKMLEQWSKVFVAVDDEIDEIVWTITVLIEQKLTRWWAKAAHLEELITRKWWQGKGIWSQLMKQAITYAQSQNAYKIILDCDPSLVGFYKRFGFEQSEVMMRRYL